MRPLEHLGVGIGTDDYQLNQLDSALYDTLSNRGEDLLESAKKDFMGNYYNNAPLKTRDELQKDCDRWLKQKKSFEDLRAPEILISNAEENIIELYQAIQNKKYGSMSDSVYKKYREAYYNKEDEWNLSTEKETLLNEIYSYNEIEYNKIKQEFAPR